MPDSYSKEGHRNLEITGKAGKFTDWMYGEVRPYLRGDILEFGSGLGTYSEKIVSEFDDSNIFLSDIDPEYVSSLAKKFRHRKNVACMRIDLINPADFEKVHGRIDSAFALNVLEHIEDDISALNNVYDALRPGGRFVILVPAHKFLHNTIDVAVGHYRRYSEKDVKEAVSKTKFKMARMFYFNFLGILGWFINGNLLRRTIVDENALNFFNRLVPLMKFFNDKILRKKVGLSLIVILEKPAQNQSTSAKEYGT